MYLVVLVGNFMRQDVREWFPSTTGPLLPTMTDSLLAPGRGVLYKVRHKGCHFCPGEGQGGHGEPVQLFRMKRVRNKGVYCEQC